jgi:hypothetical protein
MESLTFQSELGNFGISLHKRIVESLIAEIESAIADGRIRSQDGRHSVFDFIREILGKKNSRNFWARLTISVPNCVAICDAIIFKQEGPGRPQETLATDLAGLLVVAYLADCRYSQQLRSASASYFAADRNSVTPPVPPILFELTEPSEKPAKLREHIHELEDKLAASKQEIADFKALLADWEAKYRYVYDRMQYFQARSMGAALLDRLQNKPDDFSEDSDFLWIVAGVHSKYYFCSRCKEDLEYGVDYLPAGKARLRLTPHGAIRMMLNLRSRKGVAVRYLPQTVEVDIPKTLGKNESKINRRQLHQQQE